MVRKFVFVPNAGPPPPRRRSAAPAAGVGKALQWVLLGAALLISALAFAAAKSSFERSSGAAAVQR